VPDPAASHRTAEYRGDVVLYQKIGEALGTVAAGEGDGHEHASGKR
jgi:hypothetical protein